MKLLLTVVTSFLTILGALHLISTLLVELGKPKIWASLNKGRQTFLVLVFSIVTGSIVGWFRNKKRKHKDIHNQRLNDLETKLFQLDGLLRTAVFETNPERKNTHDRYLKKYTMESADFIRNLVNQAIKPLPFSAISSKYLPRLEKITQGIKPLLTVVFPQELLMELESLTNELIELLPEKMPTELPISGEGVEVAHLSYSDKLEHMLDVVELMRERVRQEMLQIGSKQ